MTKVLAAGPAIRLSIRIFLAGHDIFMAGRVTYLSAYLPAFESASAETAVQPIYHSVCWRVHRQYDGLDGAFNDRSEEEEQQQHYEQYQAGQEDWVENQE